MSVTKCLTCSSDTVQYVTQYGVYHGDMASVLGRNVVFDYEQYTLSMDV